MIQIAPTARIVVVLVKPVGGFMTRVFAGERTWLTPGWACGAGFYRLAGIRRTRPSIGRLRRVDAAVHAAGFLFSI